MDRDAYPTPGIDAFWEDADRDGSGDDPLERELCDRLDALARYRRMIAEAQVNAQDDATEHLLKLHEREHRIVQRLTEVIRRFGRRSRP